MNDIKIKLGKVKKGDLGIISISDGYCRTKYPSDGLSIVIDDSGPTRTIFISEEEILSALNGERVIITRSRSTK